MGLRASRTPAVLLLATAGYLLFLTVALAAQDPCAGGAPVNYYSLSSYANSVNIYLNQQDNVYNYWTSETFSTYVWLYLSTYYSSSYVSGNAEGPAKCFSQGAPGGGATVSCSVPGWYCAGDTWYTCDSFFASFSVTASGKCVKSYSGSNTNKYSDLTTTPATVYNTAYKNDGFDCSKSCVFTVAVSHIDTPDVVVASFTSTDFSLSVGTSRSRFCN